MTCLRQNSFITRRAVLGVTLVELIAFIVIAGIVAAAMIQAFSGTMRGSHYGKEITKATQLAQERMEVILGQRKTLGFSGLTTTTFDPCDATGTAWTAQPCTALSYSAGAFSVASNFNNASDACGAGTGTNCAVITVTVTGPYGDVLALVTEHVWNY